VYCRIILVFVFILVINLIDACCLVAKPVVANQEGVLKACQWLKGQQKPRTGLIRSYDMPGDTTAWTYDQAVAIIALVSVGDIDAARHCTDAMLQVRDMQHRAWTDGYDSETREVKAEPIAIGPNAWMGLALLKLYQTTDKGVYLSAAREVAEFILKQQIRSGRAAGSIPGGYDEKRKAFIWTSTEHNVDAIAFLAALAKVTNEEHYYGKAIRIAEWLDGEMWDAEARCYHPGYKDNKTCAISNFPERLDSQTWIILALHAAAQTKQNKKFVHLMHNGLPWIDQYLCRVNYQDKQLAGFAKITLGDRASPSFWAEGTAGYLLASRMIGHRNSNLSLILKSLRRLQRADGSIPYSVGISLPDVVKQFQPADAIVAHFEAHPNCLFGQLGVYGDGEPDWNAITKAKFREPYSWYYEPGKPGYDRANVHTGRQSFRLVNAGTMCASRGKRWASLGIDLGPRIGNRIKAVDVSDYREFVFWAKTGSKTGAKAKVLFRDAHALGYLPQASVPPVPPRIENTWKKHVVNLRRISRQVDLSKLVHVGLAFGKDVENPAGTILYIDDMAFTGSDTITSISNGATMPAVFPQHWPYASVAATAWFIFAELNLNPFALGGTSSTGL